MKALVQVRWTLVLCTATVRGSGLYLLLGVVVGDGVAAGSGVMFEVSVGIFQSSPSRITDQYPLICLDPFLALDSRTPFSGRPQHLLCQPCLCYEGNPDRL